MQLTDQTQNHGQTLGSLVVQEMRLLYGAKFAQQWQGLAPKELREAWDQKLWGLSEREIRLGLVACLAREWPPTLPEFLRLCRPWTNPEVAYHDAVAGLAARRRGEMGLWAHPAIYWSAVAVGPHDLLQGTYGAMKARWERVFAAELEKGEWPEIPPVREALPAPGHTRATRDDIDPEMRKMVASVSRPKRNQREWANRILAEHARKGGRRCSITVLAMAKRAAGVELTEGEAA
ncbi:hypothetical protein CEG14_05635 [Bordetella genomosp. 1]|uniref:Uncharacterized protein n=1 Tax=Bordetella genomosp. 1 TaxID=1395607 RepID=A0A261SPT6_9BORD|nr:hypothetical protein [Bordetella genomosp. 1]OZI39017.1 hypothetical protein CEG14_05635 [Bordetella genomosp. 1]